MEIYKSKHFKIEHEVDQNYLIQSWPGDNLTIEDFQKEMLTFAEIYRKIKPSSIIWLQDNFKLEIPPSLHAWIEKEVNTVGYNLGLHKIAFTVSKEFLSQLSIQNVFDEQMSVLQPRYFTHEEEARLWLKENKEDLSNSIKKWEIDLRIDEAKDSCGLHIKHPLKDLKHLYHLMKRAVDEDEFRRKNKARYYLLSTREKEILRLTSMGYSSAEIALKYNISHYTVSTHRKKIFVKLEAKSQADLFKFAHAFYII